MKRWMIGLCLAPLTLLAAPQRPNFVFLLVDDLGWGDFGCYGAQFYETPHIDRLAEQSVRFTQGYAACTVCSPSRAAIMTGCYPGRLHLTDWIAGHKRPYAKLSVPDWQMKIDHERTTLPEALKEGGYATAFFGKWHLMPHEDADCEEHYPTAHGFDSNVGGREWGQPKGKGKYFSPFQMPNLDDGEPGDFLTDKLTDAALDYLDAATPDQPFLLYFSYYSLHKPVMCPPALKAKYTQKAIGWNNALGECLDPERAGMAERLDDSVGRVLAKLDELGLAENTVVILTGDNGGSFKNTSGGLREYKGYAHEGGVREPLLIKWPGVTHAGTVCEQPVIGTDFFPTMLAMAGLPQRPEAHADGVNLAPLLRGTVTELERDALYWHYPHYHKTKPYGAIRQGDWKLIEFFEDGQLELFNLKDDAKEKHNLATAQPERAAELLQKLKKWRRSVHAQMMTENPDYDPARQNSTRKSKARSK